ncbi:unnamed protein product [Scytosiphon promiscuus]
MIAFIPVAIARLLAAPYGSRRTCSVSHEFVKMKLAEKFARRFVIMNPWRKASTLSCVSRICERFHVFIELTGSIKTALLTPPVVRTQLFSIETALGRGLTGIRWRTVGLCKMLNRHATGGVSHPKTDLSVRVLIERRRRLTASRWKECRHQL